MRSRGKSLEPRPLPDCWWKRVSPLELARRSRLEQLWDETSAGEQQPEPRGPTKAPAEARECFIGEASPYNANTPSVRLTKLPLSTESQWPECPWTSPAPQTCNTIHLENAATCKREVHDHTVSWISPDAWGPSLRLTSSTSAQIIIRVRVPYTTCLEKRCAITELAPLTSLTHHARFQRKDSLQ